MWPSAYTEDGHVISADVRADECMNDSERGTAPLWLSTTLSGRNKLIQPERGWLSVFSWLESSCSNPAASPVPMAGGARQELLFFLPGWSQKMIRADQEAKV